MGLQLSHVVGIPLHWTMSAILTTPQLPYVGTQQVANYLTEHLYCPRSYILRSRVAFQDDDRRGGYCLCRRDLGNPTAASNERSDS